METCGRLHHSIATGAVVLNSGPGKHEGTGPACQSLSADIAILGHRQSLSAKLEQLGSVSFCFPVGQWKERPSVGCSEAGREHGKGGPKRYDLDTLWIPLDGSCQMLVRALRHMCTHIGSRSNSACLQLVADLSTLPRYIVTLRPLALPEHAHIPKRSCVSEGKSVFLV